MRSPILLLSLSSAVLAAGVPYMTEPTLCPTRPEIAFVSGGDIWVAPAKGGEAHLLVSHPADESRPVDIAVSRPIGESYSGKDSQLDAAVKELLAEIRK